MFSTTTLLAFCLFMLVSLVFILANHCGCMGSVSEREPFYGAVWECVIFLAVLGVVWVSSEKVLLVMFCCGLFVAMSHSCLLVAWFLFCEDWVGHFRYDSEFVSCSQILGSLVLWGWSVLMAKALGFMGLVPSCEVLYWVDSLLIFSLVLRIGWSVLIDHLAVVQPISDFNNSRSDSCISYTMWFLLVCDLLLFNADYAPYSYYVGFVLFVCLIPFSLFCLWWSLHEFFVLGMESGDNNPSRAWDYLGWGGMILVLWVISIVNGVGIFWL